MPNPTRTTCMFLNAEDIEKIAQSTNWDKLMTAIAYLSTWNIATFPVVTITRDRMDTNDLFALYHDPKHPERRYSIGAVWHGDHYGFHS